MEQSPSWEANSHSVSQVFPHLLWSLKVHYHVHRCLSCARCIQSTTSNPLSLRFIITLSSYLCLGFQSHLFPSECLTKILYAFLISPIHATSPSIPSYTPWYEVYKLWRSSLWSLLQPHASYSLCPYTVLSTLFWDTLNLFSLLTVRDQVSHPYKTSKI